MTRRTLQLLLLAAFSSSGALAQINCASGPASTKLACEFPFATGVLTNAQATGNQSLTAQQVAESLNIAIATQVSQLPLASASAGTVEVYRAGVPQTFDNLGPILTDRASTIGKHSFFIGFTASQFVFTDIDGKSLTSLPFTYVRPTTNSSGVVTSNTYTNETTRANLKVDQFVGVATFGVTNRIDISAIVPWEYVSFGNTTSNSINYTTDPSNNILFQTPPSTTYFPGTSYGIGDVTFNIKRAMWTGEHATVAAEFNLRTPTGDDVNLLGSGAYGFNPFVVYSYLWKVSPHAKIGYQWNTKSELNNPTLQHGGNLALPGGLQYDLGADWALAKRLTVAGDILGNQFLNTPKIVIPTTATETLTKTGSSTTVPLYTTTTENSSYTLNNFSAGLKIALFRNLVVSGNMLVQLNNNGLRSRPTPLVGISYKF
jgi:hypothetical protein